MSNHDSEQRLYQEALSGKLSRRDLLKRAILLGLSPAVASYLAACAMPAPQATAPGGERAADSAPSGPRAGGTSVWAAESDPVSMNPITNSNFSSTQGFEHCYESLVGYDSDLNLVPALAERWETPDDTTYIFHLRRGVKWHDGSDFSADDVKYTFDIVLDPEGPAIWRNNFDAVESVEVVDSHTVKFTTRRPFPPLLGAFAILRSSAIIKRGAMEETNLDNEINGTGPYKLVRYLPQDVIELERNPDYWGNPLPYLEKVSFKILTEEDARVAGLRAGSIDYALLTPLGEQRLRNEQNLNIMSGPRVFLYVFVFNMLREPWSDVRVRQAISMAVDRDELIEKALFGTGTIAGPMPTGFGNWFVPPAELREKWYTPNLERARQLLDEAGVPEGQELDLLVAPFGGSDFYTNAAVVLKDQLEKIGITVNIRQVEVGVFVQEASLDGNWNYDMNINAFSPRHDPDGFVWARFYSENTFAVGYKNERVDELLVEARSTIDQAQRKALYDEAQRILLDESPMIWVGSDNIIEAVQNYVKGYTQSPFTRRDWGLKHTWLDK
jgi:peptide/nickel transport system substrate-binding protein